MEDLTMTNYFNFYWFYGMDDGLTPEQHYTLDKMVSYISPWLWRGYESERPTDVAKRLFYENTALVIY